MTRPLVILRPEPGLMDTVALAHAMGIESVASPLFAVEAVAWHVPEPASFDAILAGSANAFREGGPGLAALRPLPVLAVGERTAAAARSAGFTVARTGVGGLQSLLDAMDAPSRLLRLAGEERVNLAVPDGIILTERVVYRAIPLELTADAQHVLRSGAVAALHSGAGARQFASECDRLELDRAGIAIVALAPRIAVAAGRGWRLVAVADAVDDRALLATAAMLCQ